MMPAPFKKPATDHFNPHAASEALVMGEGLESPA